MYDFIMGGGQRKVFFALQGGVSIGAWRHVKTMNTAQMKIIQSTACMFNNRKRSFSCFKITPSLFLIIPTEEYKAQGTLRCVNAT